MQICSSDRDYAHLAIVELPKRRKAQEVLHAEDFVTILLRTEPHGKR